MPKKFQLIRKKISKDIAGRAISYVAGSAGTVGAAFLTNKVIGDKINPKFVGTGLFALGLAGAIVLEDNPINSLVQGMGHYGAMHMTGNLILPDKKTEFFGMSGIGTTDDNDWDAAAQFAKAASEAEAAAMSGIYSDPENLDDNDNPVGAIYDTPANAATLVM